MIVLYSGTPGSGKSLHQAKDVYDRLKCGKPVIANYEIKTEVIKSSRLGDFVFVPNDELKPSFLISYARQYFQSHRFKEGAIRLYIDEAQLLFNAREWDMQGRKAWISFFTQHRKYGFDVYLVAQFDRMLDRQVRSLIEYEYIHRKVSNYGWKGKLISFCSFGNLFVSVKVWYPLKEKVGSEFFKYHKEYAQIYDTFKDFAVFGENDEKIVDQSRAGTALVDPNGHPKTPIAASDRRILICDLCNVLNQVILKRSVLE